MTKPLIELVEEYGDQCQIAYTWNGTPEGAAAMVERDALLSEIRQRLSSLQQDADLVPALMLQIERLEAGSVGVVPRTIWQLECRMGAPGGQRVYWIDCSPETYEIERKAGGPCRIVYEVDGRTITPQRLQELEANERRYLWIRSKINCERGTTFAMPQINTLAGVKPGQQTYGERFDACVDAAIDASAGRG